MARKLAPKEQTTGRPRNVRPSPDTLAGSLAVRVESLRDAKGWTQTQLAKAAGVGLGTVQRIEAGECDPKLGTIVSIAKALSMKARDVMNQCDAW